MGSHLHDSDATLFQPGRKGGGTKECFFYKKRGSRLLWATRFWLLPFVSCPAPMRRMLVCMERCALRAEDPIDASRHRSWSDLKQSSPRAYERRDSWGVVSYPNVEKGAIRNRRARAHAPQRHRGRPRPYHPPWRSGERHHRRP